MTKIFLTLMLLVSANMQSAWAVMPASRNSDRAQVLESGDAITGFILLEKLFFIAPKSELNTDQWAQYNSLLVSAQEKYGETERKSIVVEKRSNVHPMMAKADPMLRNLTGPLQKFDIEIRSAFQTGAPFNVGLTREVFIRGRVITSPKCQSVLNCSEVYQFYIDEIGVRTNRFYQLGGESGAGK